MYYGSNRVLRGYKMEIMLGESDRTGGCQWLSVLIYVWVWLLICYCSCRQLFLYSLWWQGFRPSLAAERVGPWLLIAVDASFPSLVGRFFEEGTIKRRPWALILRPSLLCSIRLSGSSRRSNLACTKTRPDIGLYHKFVYCFGSTRLVLSLHFGGKKKWGTSNSGHWASCEWQMAMLRHQKNGDPDNKRRWRLLSEPSWYRSWAYLRTENESVLRTRRRPLPPRPAPEAPTRRLPFLRAHTGAERREPRRVKRKSLASISSCSVASRNSDGLVEAAGGEKGYYY